MEGDTGSSLLHDLLTTTKDGDWGKESPEDGFVPYRVIRGTDFPRVRVGDISSVPLRYLSESSVHRRTLEPDDILLETAGGSPDRPTGRSLLITESVLASLDMPATCASFARFLRINRTKADPRFVYWHLQHLYATGAMEEHQVQHTGVARFQYTKFAESVRIPLPALSEQRKIAHVLGTLDDKIELNRRMNKTLEAMARAIFKSWFVDFDPVRAKAEGRDSELPKQIADLFPDRFEDSEPGEIPEGWEVRRLGDVVSVVDYVANGSFASLKEKVTLLDLPGYALYLRTTDYNSRFSGGFRYVSKDAYDFLSKSALTGSEVIISNVGDVGTVFRPPTWLGWPMTLGSNAVALKARGADNYLFNYFRDSVGQNAISSIVTGSAQPKFNKTNLRDLRIPLPDPRILQVFEKLASKLADRQNILLKESRALAAIRDTLLPKLISGELHVKDAERFLETQV